MSKWHSIAVMLARPALAASVLVFTAAWLSPVNAAPAEAVTIDTNGTIRLPPVRLEAAAPEARATVILMTGGNGLLNVDTTTGEIINSTGNFLIRSANFYLKAGYNVMMPDSAPAFPATTTANTLGQTARLGTTHAGHMQTFITSAASRWGKPVFMVGTSNGSVSTVAAAGGSPALSGLTGIILTSPVTSLGTNQTLFNQDVARIALPTLVVWHQSDACTASTPAGASNLYGNITSSIKEQRVVAGGHSVATDPCGPFSEHGYAGIEEAVSTQITKFISLFLK